MKLVQDKLRLGWLDKPKAFQRGLSLVLIYSLIVPSFTWSTPASDETSETTQDKNAPNASMKKAILMLPSVQGALTIIGNLNQAMRTAAENPNDDWRREEVRKAMSAVPLAVQQVASSFSSNAMGNSSLPFVLSLMGGFVDVDAPNSFDKFLKNPSHDFIPTVGKEFPSEYLGKGEEISIVLNEKPIASSSSAQQTISAESATDTANLNLKSNPVSTFQIPTPVVESNVNRTIASSSATEFSPSQPFSPVVRDLNHDIRSVETVVTVVGNQVSIAAKENSEIEKSNDEIFSQKKVVKKSEKRKKSSLRKPTSWLLSPLFNLGAFVFESEGHAETGGGAGLGMGGGPQSNPQDQSGGGAAGVLTGIAAIIAAVSPMIVASQQTQSEQKIAKIESQTQVQQAQIQSQTQKDLANLNAQTTLTQAQVQKDTAQLNNDAQTQRLQMNLASSQMQRNEERQSQAEQLAAQRQMEEQKIALAKMQADESIRIAKENFESQKLAALLQGASARTVQSASAARAAGNPLAAALAASATQGSSSDNGSNNPSYGLARGLSGVSAPSSRLSEESVSARLLASVDSPLSGLEQNPAVKQSMRRGFSGRRGAAISVRRAPLRKADGSYRNGIASVAAGSFSARALTAKRSDLIQFAAEQQPVTESFVDYQNNRRRALGSAQTH
jgi:hypothetical protein